MCVDNDSWTLKTLIELFLSRQNGQQQSAGFWPVAFDSFAKQHEELRAAHQTTNERFHGVESRNATKNGVGTSADAQFRDQQSARVTVASSERQGESAVHRGGETATSGA